MKSSAERYGFRIFDRFRIPYPLIRTRSAGNLPIETFAASFWLITGAARRLLFDGKAFFDVGSLV